MAQFSVEAQRAPHKSEDMHASDQSFLCASSCHGLTEAIPQDGCDGLPDVRIGATLITLPGRLLYDQIAALSDVVALHRTANFLSGRGCCTLSETLDCV